MNPNFPYTTRLTLNDAGADWVIPDIHGCPRTLNELLVKIDLTVKDRLFLLGDLVNKGPDSTGVLDKLIEMEGSGFQILKILGNHDLYWIEYLDGKNSPEASNIDQREIAKIAPEKIESYKQFLSESYYYLQIENCILVHAGFDFQDSDPMTNFEAMLSIKNFEPDPAIVGKRKIIHGHLAHEYPEIAYRILHEKQRIPLDNGCVYKNSRKGMGKLLALNLKTFELISQLNVDI